MSKIPRLRLPDGSIFEPTLRYFAYGWLNKIFKAKSSMEPDSLLHSRVVVPPYKPRARLEGSGHRR